MRGEITVRVRCLTPEKLVDRATSRGACFDTVRLEDDGALIVSCDAASSGVLLSLCERFGISAEITCRRGGSAARYFLRRRATLIAGILCAVLLCALFLSRVWIVDVAFTGEAAALGDAAVLSRALDALGVRPGIARNLDTSILTRQLQAGERPYSYVGARLQGVRLLVEAAPELPAPRLYDVDAPRDLVSSMDGVVVRAVARSGEVCVKPGDAVRRGQLVIRGEEQSSGDETRPIAALGEVVVRSWYAGEASLPLRQARNVDTGRRSTGATLTALGFSWPMTEAEAFDHQRVEREVLPIGGLFLPVQIVRETFVETRREESDIPADTLKARARALALADAGMALGRIGPKQYTVLGDWADYSYRDGSLYARAVLEIQADAAATREAIQGG